MGYYILPVLSSHHYVQADVPHVGCIEECGSRIWHCGPKGGEKQRREGREEQEQEQEQ